MLNRSYSRYRTVRPKRRSEFGAKPRKRLGRLPLMGWPGRVQRLLCWTRLGRRYAKLKEHAMRTSQQSLDTVSTIGIDVGKNTFHLVGFDPRGAIVLQQKVTRHQLG